MTDLVPRSQSSLPACESGAPELQLLQWILALPSGLDPAVAARTVLGRSGEARQPELPSRLHALLETVAAYPAERLGRLRRRRRRAVSLD